MPTDSGQAMKPVLVLLHGFPLDHEMWRPQIVKFVPQCRVIAPDLPGFGCAEPPTIPFSMDSIADSIVQMLESSGISKKVVLCGLSMGGYIALAIARRHPGRLQGLILADTRAEPDDETGKENRNRMIELVSKSGPEAIIDMMLPKLLGATTQQGQPGLRASVRAMAARQSAEGISAALVAMRDRPDARPALAEIRVPTLVIVGEEDANTPVSMASALAKSIQGASLEVIPRAGHLSNLENSAAFNSAVERFNYELMAKSS